VDKYAAVQKERIMLMAKYCQINGKFKKLSGRATGLGIKLMVSVCCLELTQTSVFFQIDRDVATIS